MCTRPHRRPPGWTGCWATSRWGWAISFVIASFCVHHGHHLLHSDRDFDPFVHHLGLRLA